MAWWGKLIGGAFGFMLGGPLGALLGGVLGHGLDRGMGLLEDSEALDPEGRERVQTAFFTATFSVMGHLAKADGRVSRREITLAESVIARMELSPDMRRVAIGLFTEGKVEGFPLDDVLEQFRRKCRRRRSLMRMFIEIQIQAAYADGRPGAEEKRLLLYICDYLGISEHEFWHLEQLVRLQRTFSAGTQWDHGHIPQRPAAERPTLDQAYAALGVASKATDAEVKRVYRRLLSQHHPDKLVSKGLPEEMMKLAAEKTHEIRKAYEAITHARAL